MSVFLGSPQVLPTRGVPTQGPLTDRFGRTATDLRISLTDKCNLRCTYSVSYTHLTLPTTPYV